MAAGIRRARYVLPVVALFALWGSPAAHSLIAPRASLTQPPQPAPPATQPAPPAPGRSSDNVSPRYKQFCSSCHGIDGQGFGSSAYDEGSGEFVGDLHEHRPANLTCPGIGLAGDEELERVVRGGISCQTHGQVMPAFPNLTQAQFSEIAEQVRTFASQHLGHDPSEHK